ncbi:MAG: LysR family transcriptional regulator [Pseudomonadota bacterium]
MADSGFFYAKFHSQIANVHTFIAAARSGSFTAAARTLRLTQPTVSQQIADLEETAGDKLFNREHRGVALTESGRKFYNTCAQHFDEIETAFQALYSPGQKNRVRLATDFAFSTYWLLPRLTEMQRSFAKLDLQIITALVPSTIDRADWDLLVEYREDASTADNCKTLFSENVVAVCSSGFFERLGPFKTVDALQSVPHITMELGACPQFYDWHRWYALLGSSSQNISVGFTAGNFMLGCQAALAGHGLFLSQKEFVVDYLNNGDLVSAFPFVGSSERPYVVEHKRNMRSIEAGIFAWICERMATND